LNEDCRQSALTQNNMFANKEFDYFGNDGFMKESYGTFDSFYELNLKDEP